MIRMSRLLAALLAVALCATLASSALADGSPVAAKKKVSLKIKGKSQKDILKSGVKVKVKGKKAQEGQEGQEGDPEARLQDLRRPGVRLAGEAEEGEAEQEGEGDGRPEALRRRQGAGQDLPGADDPGRRRKGAKAKVDLRPRHRPMQAADDRPEPGRSLRLHRRPGQLALHAPVPRRLLHGQRQPAPTPAGGSTSRPTRRRRTPTTSTSTASPTTATTDSAPGSRSSSGSPGSTTRMRWRPPTRSASPISAATAKMTLRSSSSTRRPASAGRSGPRSTPTPAPPRRRRC